MIVINSKGLKRLCHMTCPHCFQDIMYRNGKLETSDGDIYCPHCMEDLINPLDLMDRVMSRIAYFYSAESDGDLWDAV